VHIRLAWNTNAIQIKFTCEKNVICCPNFWERDGKCITLLVVNICYMKWREINKNEACKTKTKEENYTATYNTLNFQNIRAFENTSVNDWRRPDWDNSFFQNTWLTFLSMLFLKIKLSHFPDIRFKQNVKNIKTLDHYIFVNVLIRLRIDILFKTSHVAKLS